MSERDPDSDIEREIRDGRKFTPQEAMARMAGPGAMKGASPVAQSQQAEIEIGTWLRGNIADPSGALSTVMHRHLKGSVSLLNNVEQPLTSLANYCRTVLGSDHLIEEFVREADVEWDRLMDERPHFQRAGSQPHSSDPYTHESVRDALTDVLRRLDRG